MLGPVTCGHCGRTITTAARGFANDTDLCHTGTIPPGDDPPDCLRLVTVYQHAADGSCCRDRTPPPWRLGDAPDDFAGCGRLCRKHGKHTLQWGDCEYGERPAPMLGYFSTFTAEDGEVSGGEHEFPLSVFLQWAARLTADDSLLALIGE